MKDQQPKRALPSSAEIQSFRRRHAEDPTYGTAGHRWVEVVQGLSDDFATRDILDYGCGKQTLAKALGWAITGYDPAFEEVGETPGPAEIVVCTNVLEQVAAERLEATLEHISSLCGSMAFVVVSTARSSDHATVQTLAWWKERLAEHFDVVHAQEIPGDEAIFLLAPPIRIFIGSEPRMWAAEKVLCHSIDKHTTARTKIEVMNGTRDSPWAEWNSSSEEARSRTTRGEAPNASAGATEYLNYRWAIAEHCNFRGRAIYFDVNALVLGDVRELAQGPMNRPILTLTPQQTGVMLIDCRAVGKLREWPRIAEMQNGGWGIEQYVEALHRQDVFGLLPSEWNCLDGRGYKEGVTRLIHFTDMSTQPWRPYPDRITYQNHPCPEMERLWFEYAADARENRRFASDDEPLRAISSVDVAQIATAG